MQALFRRHTEFGTQLYVKTMDHGVYLTGQVNTELQRDSAESLGRGVAGVRKVINNVAVSYSGRWRLSRQLGPSGTAQIRRQAPA